MKTTFPGALFLLSTLFAAHGMAFVPGKPAQSDAKARIAPAALRDPGFPGGAAQSMRLFALKAAIAPAIQGLEEKRVQVGAPRNVAAETIGASGAPAALQWVAAPAGGLTARLTLTSPEAAALRLGLRIRELPAGAELRFTGSAAPDRVIGPVGAKESLAAMRALGIYWTPVTEGDTQSVEVWIPAGSESARVRIAVESASHLVATPANMLKSAGLGASQSCQKDVVCTSSSDPALAKAARSVAKLLYTENGSSYICSGTLVNDGDATTQVPYVYTAAHCIGSQAAAATLNSFWSFEATSCGNKGSANYTQLNGGATLLYASAASDVALVRLADRAPDGAWFSGWDASPLQPGAALVALHHPAGDLKKVTLGQSLDATPISSGASFSTAAWSSGSTEGGSSGSGLFTLANGEYVLRGGLRGGSASCGSAGHTDDPANRDYYSRIDLEAGSLKAWLASTPAPLDDYTDMWFNPDEPGSGISIIQNAANRMFVALYTYDAASRPTWIVLPEGTWSNAATYEGALYRASGSAFDRPYDASKFSIAAAGTGRIVFTQNDAATLTFTVDGKTVVKTIRRQPI